MNRRSLLKSLLGAAIGSCVRWLPMAEKPLVEAEELTFATMPLTATEYTYLRDEVWRSMTDCDRAIYHAGIDDHFEYAMERRLAEYIEFMRSRGWHP